MYVFFVYQAALLDASTYAVEQQNFQQKKLNFTTTKVCLTFTSPTPSY